MASEALRQLVKTMREGSGAADPDITMDKRREQMAAGTAGFTIPADVEVSDVRVADVPCRWTRVPDAREDKVLVYLHGGGYVMGSLDTHQELMGRLARHCRAKVLGVEYRLAPEHPFPAGLDDAVAVYEATLASGVTAGDIMIGGDSAGGGLALATLLAARDKGMPMPAGAILFSPWTDLMATGESVATRADADPMITGGPATLLEMAVHYHGEVASGDDPLVSPQYADLTGLPPLLIQVGDAEVLLSDSTRLADNAKAAGVSASLEVWDEAPHVFQALPMAPERLMRSPKSVCSSKRGRGKPRCASSAGMSMDCGPVPRRVSQTSFTTRKQMSSGCRRCELLRRNYPSRSVHLPGGTRTLHRQRGRATAAWESSQRRRRAG